MFEQIIEHNEVTSRFNVIQDSDRNSAIEIIRPIKTNTNLTPIKATVIRHDTKLMLSF